MDCGTCFSLQGDQGETKRSLYMCLSVLGMIIQLMTNIHLTCHKHLNKIFLSSEKFVFDKHPLIVSLLP